MSKYLDLTGMRFGRLVVQKQKMRSKDRNIIWECKCECGNTTAVFGKDLKRGHTKSCGCLQKDKLRERRFKHGDRDSRLYSVWKTMKKRCENQNHKSYQWYGANGVVVCDEWHDYSTFKEWAMQNGYDENAKRGECTIDRIDPYGNYEPKNCRWVSMAEQAKNKRKTA